MATLKNTIINDTGYLGIPSGSESQRPNSPETGYMRFNTDNSVPEIWDGSEWKEVSLTEYVKTYSVTDSTTSTNEGTTITFTTTTENVSNGTTLYYTLTGVDSNDVSTGTSGNFTINNNSGTVSVSITNDTTTEGSETLTFQVRTDSTSGTIVASDTTTINDTSLSPFVTSGLLVHLDAGDSNSYPGSGTTWTDLSGNGYHGTLVNGPTFSSNNGGVIVLDGSNDFIQVNLDRRSGDYTIMGAARYINSANDGRTFSAKDNNWLMGHWSSTTENHYAVGWVSSVDAGPADTNWRIYTATRSGSDTWSFYVNNSLKNTNSGGSGGPYNFTIGKYGPGNSEHSNSEISFFMVYDRVLSSSEMTQNYNAFKDRFGL